MDKRNADKIATIAKPVTHLLDSSFKTCHNYVYSSKSSKEYNCQMSSICSVFNMFSPCSTATTV